jgi:hypothetical protein
LISAGCSVSLPEREEPQPPRDYQRLVGQKLPSLLSKDVILGNMQISPLRRDSHYFAGDWSVCLKIDAAGKPQLFTVFFSKDEIVQTRLAVQIDACARETFEDFKIAPEPVKPGH